MNTPIITSLIDQDLYKLSMGQIAFNKHSGVQVEFAYKCRTEGVDLSPYAGEIREQIEHVCDLRITRDELDYLKTRRYLKPGYLEFLKMLRLDPEGITITTNPFKLKIKGGWSTKIYFEIFVLSIIGETYYRHQYSDAQIQELYAKGDEVLTREIARIKEFARENPTLAYRLIEFGTRRRFTKEWQEHVLKRLVDEIPGQLFGTSNLLLAKKYDLRPIGTMAHEFLQAYQALGPRLIDTQKAALEAWVQEYRGDLGIALTDVISMNAFLRDFDLFYAKLFDGLRHDSGDPYQWAEKAIAHYEGLNIDPRTKALVFSDSLNVEKSLDLCKTFEPRIKTSYGIGTFLTNNIPGVKPINSVMKMTRCNDMPVAKLSDSPGKSMCEDAEYIAYLKKVFNYPN